MMNETNNSEWLLTLNVQGYIQLLKLMRETSPGYLRSLRDCFLTKMSFRPKTISREGKLQEILGELEVSSERLAFLHSELQRYHVTHNTNMTFDEAMEARRKVDVLSEHSKTLKNMINSLSTFTFPQWRKPRR
jgi:hypothetical protein